MTSIRQKGPPLPLILFSLTLFLSAALMFTIEPMIGKMLLPLVGGAPAGWIVALAFFQVMLLLGYLYAHVLSRFPARVHAILYLAALCLGMLFLPVRMPPPETTGSPTAPEVFWLLITVTAIPFIALAATSSTLQRLFSTAGHASSDDPYFLYAASNLGSFAGLLLYPLALEPVFGLEEQALYWRYAFGLLAGCAVLCFVLGYNRKQKDSTASAPVAVITLKQRLEWIALAFVPSSLLLGVTTHISTDVFSAPMIWILPLALYLLTFVIAFSRKPLLKLKDVMTFQPLAVALVVSLLMSYDADVRASSYAMGFHLLAFGTVALLCHMRLAQQRPLGDGRALTGFYLMIALGGALGSLLNAFIVPVVLDRLAEYPAMMILSCMLNPLFQQDIPKPARRFLVLGLGGVGLYVFYIMTASQFIHGVNAGGYTAGMRIADILLVLTAMVLATNVRTVFYGTLALLLAYELVLPRDILLTERNFYGVVTIFDRPQQAQEKTYNLRFILHGNTNHGMQVLDPKYEKTPTYYYWKGGPAGSIFEVYKPKKIAVIGLGAGTLNCYSTPANEFTFFDIDPAVIKIAQDPKIFTFLSACKAKRPPRIIPGDGRIQMERLGAEKFDLIVLDAFSSDAIPTHLMTLEALRVYLDHLNATGILLVHISNRYFDLFPVLAADARVLKLKPLTAIEIPKDVFYAAPSKWALLAREKVNLAPLASRGWKEPAADPMRRPWTDDYTNLLGALGSAIPKDEAP